MRYRAEQLAAGELSATPAPLTDDFVTLTVWMTLVIGILFTLAGVRAGQRWLTFWGALTLLACAWYWVYLFL
ncbi:MAG: hypothetical protein FJ164_06930 [Gammaproteobacteria bacterium]|nr:hypothetical protein [Gammaproteobacteria bacterium]